MEREFYWKFGKPAHEWQLDVAEALLLGLHCVVIAGTGMGKTMPFMLPLLQDKKAKTITISPLKVLQEDQAARFKAMDITAAAVNGDAWSSQRHKTRLPGGSLPFFQNVWDRDKYYGILCRIPLRRPLEARTTLSCSTPRGTARAL
ncbi:hypothetical protein DFP72DRAFT_1163206 [Ephemerocybe angulata]|uniref:DEAD/DEAH-box helicase domain-containing protein n=1 Tax=Ephemerocybe angulata TaxID=980116 RepID=A0A8H6IEL9_9AGAR|nr:hypothetical protein DFP72DRAFT_1163206 [Tulosesus angulatus]